METAFEQVMVGTHKDEMLAFMDAHPETFKEALRLAVTDRQPFAWRAAWLVETRMEHNDRRVRGAIDSLVAALPTKADGHQRELIRILLRMELGDEQEGRLFDTAMGIWEETHKKPGARFVAFRFIMQMTDKYPDLKGEVKHLTQSGYLQPLSPGVRRSVQKMIGQRFD